jgi:hypothetical protein
MMRRDTAIPALLFLLLSAIVFRNRRAWVCLAVAAGVMIVPLGLIVLFHPEPLALGITHASPGRGAIGIRRTLTRLDKFEFLFDGGWSTILLGLTALGAACSAVLKPRFAGPVIAVGALVSGLALVVKMLDPYLVSNQNIFAFCPLAIWGLCLPITIAMRSQPAMPSVTRLHRIKEAVDDHPVESILWALAVGGPLVVALSEYDSGGAQWGPRYLLFAFPILVLLSLKAREHILSSKALRGTRLINYSFVAVIGLSVLLQAFSLLALDVQKGLSAKTASAVARSGAQVTVSASPIIDVLAPTYAGHEYLYAPTQRDLVTLMTRLRGTGIHTVAVLCEPIHSCHWDAFAGWSHGPKRILNHKVGLAVYSPS